MGGSDGRDGYKDDREEYYYNDIAIVYNAGFQTAVAGKSVVVTLSPRQMFRKCFRLNDSQSLDVYNMSWLHSKPCSWSCLSFTINISRMWSNSASVKAVTSVIIFNVIILVIVTVKRTITFCSRDVVLF